LYFVARVCSTQKPPIPSRVIAASVPPVIITSAKPSWIHFAASPIASALEEQAVTTV